MALAVGSALYYVSPAFRTLTETVTSTLTQTEPKTVTTILTQPESTLIRSTERTTERETAETTINTYRMTASTIWYHAPAHKEQEYEVHFKTARRGKIADVRRALETEGTAYFQKAVYRQFGRRVPKRKLRIGFEREEPATDIQNDTEVQTMYMEYCCGKWKSTPMSPRLLSYAKKT